MLTAKAVILGALLIASTLAQERIAFQSVPPVAVEGETYNVTWGGGDDSAVTITLRKGDPDNLDTIAILAEGITGDFFAWEVSTSLEPDDDYALQITQGQDEINYSGLFSITAGNDTNSTTTSTTATSNSTASVTSTTDLNSAGTGTALPRNTTFSSPTISPTSSLTPASTQHQSTSSGAEASSTSSAPTAAATTGAPNSDKAAQLASSMALVMGVFAAVMFLS